MGNILYFEPNEIILLIVAENNFQHAFLDLNVPKFLKALLTSIYIYKFLFITQQKREN